MTKNKRILTLDGCSKIADWVKSVIKEPNLFPLMLIFDKACNIQTNKNMGSSRKVTLILEGYITKSGKDEFLDLTKEDFVGEKL